MAVFTLYSSSEFFCIFLLLDLSVYPGVDAKKGSQFQISLKGFAGRMVLKVCNL